MGHIYLEDFGSRNGASILDLCVDGDCVFGLVSDFWGRDAERGVG